MTAALLAWTLAALAPGVRVGPTTVTVIDETETVDEVISRVREKRGAGAEPKKPDKQAAPAPPEPPPRQRVETRKSERQKIRNKPEKRPAEQRARSHGGRR